MCIVQRYALVLVIIVAGVAAAFKGRAAAIAGAIGVLVFSAGGAFVGGRQSWLQWHPPEFASCGRDFYGMIETFPLSRAIPMIFRGSGDCTKIDWTMLGLSVANWSFLWFCAIFAVATVLLVRQGASSVPRRRESRGARYNPLG
jgi:disulfide bond formation protein DsbB